FFKAREPPQGERSFSKGKVEPVKPKPANGVKSKSILPEIIESTTDNSKFLEERKLYTDKIKELETKIESMSKEKEKRELYFDQKFNQYENNIKNYKGKVKGILAKQVLE